MSTKDDLMLMHIGVIERMSNLYPIFKRYTEFESVTDFGIILNEYDKATEDMIECLKEMSRQRNGRSAANSKIEKKWNKAILEEMRKTRNRLSTINMQKSSTPSIQTE